MNFFLDDFLNFIDKSLILAIKNYYNHELSCLVSNSQQVKKDALFIAIKGVCIDGEKFIDMAIKSGVKTIMMSSDINEIALAYPDVSFIQVANARLINALACQFNCHAKIQNLKLLGVTGTNGKTTTSYLFFQILKALGRKTGLISTVEYFDGKMFEESVQTTPTPEILFQLLKNMANNHVEYVPMELSSHALAQDRIGNLKFKTAIFTNLTGDHLDYHSNMDNYFEAKKLLFLNHIAVDGLAIINIDDWFGRELFEELKSKNIPVSSFGCAKDAEYQLKLISAEQKNIFELNNFRFETNLLGEYNVYNLTGVIISLLHEKFAISELQNVIKTTIFRVPGRLELIKFHSNIRVFVDYAHTDDALKNVLENLKKMRHKRIITLFGCGGNRDKTKRPRMGKVAFENSDYVIISSDNPRFEEPFTIINDILAGIDLESRSKVVEIIENRTNAIKRALEIAQKDDIVLVAGKGHEQYQEINGEKFFFDDIEEIKKYGK